MDGSYEERRISGRKPTRKLTSIAQSHKSATATRINAGEGDGQREKRIKWYKFRGLSFFSKLLVIRHNKETQFE